MIAAIVGDPPSKPDQPTPGRIGSGDVDPELSTVLPGGLSMLDGLSQLDPLLAAIAAAPSAPTMPELIEGTVIGRNFRVGHRLGSGGMGVVYLAHDLTLDRPVAVKVQRGGEGAGVDRLQREATAMARLSHPHVVTVHAVGRLDDSVFVAMEYVAGGTLRGWLRAAPRPWLDALAMCRGAGEGLAAAHDAGLVHRDFKPENVLIADGGRPKVADFGLARAQDDDRPDPVETAVTASGSGSAGATRHREDACPPEAPAHGARRDVLSDRLTMTGAMVGTPAYMAPEQFHGKVDARADQFALAVVVWEALLGQRPFAGRDPRELEQAIRRGEPAAAPRKSDVPRAVVQVIRRGLAADPADRFPSVRAFLAALDRAARPRRRALVAAAVVLALGGAATYALLGRGGAADPCARADAAVEAALTPALIARLDTALAGAHGDAATIERIRARIHGARDHLRSIASASCQAGRVDHAVSPELFARSQACLVYRAKVAAVLVDDVALIGRDVAAYATKVRALPDATTCLDSVALAANPAAPTDASIAARAELEVAATTISIDQLADAETAIDRATAAAGADPAVAALLLRVRAQLAYARGDLDRATKLYTDAYYAGQTVDDVEVYLESLAELIRIYGDDRVDAAASEPWLRAAAAAIKKDRRRSIVGVIGVLQALSAAADRRGDGVEAVGHAETALGLVHADADPLQRAESEHVLAQALAGASRFPEAITHHDAAVAACDQALGAAHPTCVGFRAELALTLGESDETDRAVALGLAAHAALASWTNTAITSRANALLAVGVVLTLVPGHYDEAAADMRAARDLFVQIHGPDHPLVALAEANLAVVGMKRGDHRAAIEAFERALPIQERALGPHHFEVASTCFNLGTAYLLLGELGAALPHAERATRIYAATAGDTSRHAYALRLHAELLTKLGRAADAAPIAAAGEAMADKLPGAAYFDLAIEVARADVALGLRPAAARARLLEARPQFGKYPDVFKRQLAEIDAILAAIKPGKTR